MKITLQFTDGYVSSKIWFDAFVPYQHSKLPEGKSKK